MCMHCQWLMPWLAGCNRCIYTRVRCQLVGELGTLCGGCSSCRVSWAASSDATFPILQTGIV